MTINLTFSKVLPALRLLGRELAYTGLGLFVVWSVLGVISVAWLAAIVPLSAQDMAQASWLGSPATALHFSTGPLGWLVVTAALVLFNGMALVLGSPRPLMVAILWGAAGYWGLSEATSVRVGVLDDTIRLGCFVEDSKECFEMLNLPAQHAPSMYAPANEANVIYADWYLTQRRQKVTPAQEQLARMYSLPGGAWLRAPLYLGRGAELAQKLQSQREAVTAYQASARAAARPR